VNFGILMFWLLLSSPDYDVAIPPFVPRLTDERYLIA